MVPECEYPPSNEMCAQPHSQGLSFSREGGRMEEPGNEVDMCPQT